jgi:hypothetical protein
MILAEIKNPGGSAYLEEQDFKIWYDDFEIEESWKSGHINYTEGTQKQVETRAIALIIAGLEIDLKATVINHIL